MASIAPGLRYLAAWADNCTAIKEFDDMEGELLEQYPPWPLELSVVLVREDMNRLPQTTRDRLQPIFNEYTRAREEIDRRVGVPGKREEVDQLRQRFRALHTLWLQELATTICGLAPRLRAWMQGTLLDSKPNPDQQNVLVAPQGSRAVLRRAASTDCPSARRWHICRAHGSGFRRAHDTDARRRVVALI